VISFLSLILNPELDVNNQDCLHSPCLLMFVQMSYIYLLRALTSHPDSAKGFVNPDN